MSHRDSHHNDAPERLEPVAALLACILPGLGHFYLRQNRRAACIAAGVIGMFLTGLLIGGISVVDRRDAFPWFVGQALVGPGAFAVDYFHQNYFKRPDPATGQPRYTVSVGRPHELGTLFCTIAGMMNLICIIDAGYRRPAPDRHPTPSGPRPTLRRRTPTGEAGP